MTEISANKKKGSIKAAYSKGFSPEELQSVVGDCISLGMSEELIKKISSLVKGLNEYHRIALTVWDKDLLTKKQIADLTEASNEADGSHFSPITEAELISYELNSYTVVNSIRNAYLDIRIVMILGRKSELGENIKQKLKNIEWTDETSIRVALTLDII